MIKIELSDIVNYSDMCQLKVGILMLVMKSGIFLCFRVNNYLSSENYCLRLDYVKLETNIMKANSTWVNLVRLQ